MYRVPVHEGAAAALQVGQPPGALLEEERAVAAGDAGVGDHKFVGRLAPQRHPPAAEGEGLTLERAGEGEERGDHGVCGTLPAWLPIPSCSIPSTSTAIRPRAPSASRPLGWRSNRGTGCSGTSPESRRGGCRGSSSRETKPGSWDR